MKNKLFILYHLIIVISLFSNIYCSKNDSSGSGITKSIIQEINRGSSDYKSDFKNPVAFNLKLFFSGNNGTEEKIYQYDGISIENISLGLSDYKNNFEYGIVYNSKLYFRGNNGDTDKIYEYNGTQINNISAGSSDYIYKFEEPVEYNSKLYFRGNNGTANKIYEFDGISISNVSTGTSDYQTGFSDGCYEDNISEDQNYLTGNEDIIIYDSKLFFTGSNGVDNNLYIFDGISISNVPKGTSDYQRGFVRPFIFNEKLYFAGTNDPSCPLPYEFNNNFNTLYEFDGESIKNIHISSEYGGFGFYSIYNSKLYFSYVSYMPGDDCGYLEIYEYDGLSTVNTVPVDPNTNYKVGFKNPFIYNSQLYFDGYTIYTPLWVDWTLYKYDGVSIKKVCRSDNWQYQKVFNSKLYFTFSCWFQSYSPLYVYDEISIKTVNANPFHGYEYVSQFDPIPFNMCIYFEGTEVEYDLSHIYECNGDDVRIVSAGTSDYKTGFNQPIIENNSQLLFKGNNGENDVIYSLVAVDK